MVTTTPRKMSLFTGLMKNVAKDPEKYHVTYAISWENPQLSDDAIERMRGQFGHNMALWKQEMEAELIDDEFALFKQGDFDKYRVSGGSLVNIVRSSSAWTLRPPPKRTQMTPGSW